MSKRRLAFVLIGLAACSADQKTVGNHVGPNAGGSSPDNIDEAPRPPTDVIASRDIKIAPPASEGSGLVITLKEGAPEPEPETSAPPPPVAEVRTLDADEAASLIARLPAIETQPGDQVDFALRESTRKRPLSGVQTTGVFPPKSDRPPPPKPKVEALQVIRMQPQGDVPIAPHLSVTFSQPMVPVTTVDQVLAKSIPVKLSPSVEGQWRWAGASTLLFEPKPRFAMATKFTLSVPAGVTSSLDAKLQEPEKFEFQTPPAVVTSFTPSGTVGRTPVMAAYFDQRIDPAAVLKKVRITAGKRNVALRLAKTAEIEKAGLSGRAAQTEKRAMFFVATKPLLVNSAIRVVFNKGVPSAEGPRVTTAARSFGFRTYGPFVYKKHRCGWQKDCRPGMPFSVEFNNPIGELKPELVTVTPAIEDVKVQNYGTTIQITGKMIGRTKYRVQVPTRLKDAYGQNLTRAVDVTFNVGPALPSLNVPGPDMMVLERTTRPSLSAYSINFPNLKVQIAKVGPNDWHKYLEYKRNHREKRAPPMPGKIVFDGLVEVAAQPDRMIETKIDLSAALTEHRGHLIITVLPGNYRRDPKRPWHWPGVLKWIQVTDIGLDALIDGDDLYAFATRLADGAPMGDVNVALQPSAITGITAQDGVSVLGLPTKSERSTSMLVATRGPDIAFLPESHWSSHQSSWVKRATSPSYRYFIFDDRALYRPKETIQIKGFIRRITNGKTGDVMALDAHDGKVVFDVRDSRNNEITKGETTLSKLGGFSLKVDIPDDVNLGRAYVNLRAPGLGSKTGHSGGHSFRIEEFRRPEFEVSVEATQGPHLVGQYGVFTAHAKYYTGGALIGADTNWRIRTTAGSYTPPGRSDYVFGAWSPWWWGRHEHGGFRGRPSGKTQSYQAKTGADGRHHLRVELNGIDPPRATVINAEASVSDVNRQTWSGSSSILVHPSASYVGLRTRRSYVPANQDVEVDVINVDLDGSAKVSKDVEVVFSMPGNEAVEPDTCRPEKAEAVCTFRPKKGGRYQIVARTKDDRGRPNESSTFIWVSGGEDVPMSRNVEEEKAQLIPDQKTYAVGDVAELLVQSPFEDAHGVYAVSREGVVKQGTFKTEGSSVILKIPIEETWTPNVHVHVYLTGKQKRRNKEQKVDPSLPPRPAFAAANISLSIPPRTRTLAVAVEPEAREAEPGTDTSVTVDVRGPSGEPAGGAEVTLYVVDEAVLALTSYTTPDPLAAFYTARGAGVRALRSRQYVYLADPEEIAETRIDPADDADEESGAEMKKAKRSRRAPAPSAVMGESAMGDMASGSGPGGGGAATPITVRKDFAALAVFEPSAMTNKSGRAVVKFKLPDSLTRYRVIAVAAHGANHFGFGESTVTARKALMVRPSAPRFLNYGDRFELPVVLENQTNESITARVVVRGTNANIQVTGFEVDVPNRNRVEVRFPTTTERPGRARFQFAAAAGAYVDAAEVDLPVWTPATTEAFATYGEIDDGAMAQPIVAPQNVAKGFGGLEITTASTQLQALTDAYIYILDYPYGCAEQVSSRVVSTAALKDVLAAFDAEGMPPEAEVLAAMGRDVKRLGQLQNSDGGWGWWRRGMPSRPFLTVHVVHALARAKDKGIDVPKPMLDRGHRYLKQIDRHLDRAWGRGVRTSIVAYSLYVRAMMGDIDQARAKTLIREAGGVSKLPMEAAGWLYPVLTDGGSLRGELAELRRMINNRATETAATAHFATSYGDGAYVLLHSARRVDALILEGMMRDQPNNPLIPKLVRGLLAHRVKGRWSNTQENAWVLLALDRYFRQYEKITPNFVARMWLGDGFAGEKAFKGRTTDQHLVKIPMSVVTEEAKRDLLIAKDGPGRLYYRIGLRYAPADLSLEAKNYGFEVTRTYEGIDDPKDVTKDTDGVWHFKAGARVRVKIQMVNTGRRYHVALVDPMPAGIEPINAALAGTGSVPNEGPSADEGWFWWRRTWYEHDNLRDERAEAFTSLLWSGSHSYSYAARATTPGVFVVPPAKAEEMYFPETFGRTATDRVIVE